MTSAASGRFFDTLCFFFALRGHVKEKILALSYLHLTKRKKRGTIYDNSSFFSLFITKQRLRSE